MFVLGFIIGVCALGYYMIIKYPSVKTDFKDFLSSLKDLF